MAMWANSVFQQILRGASRLELLEGPFQNELSGIAELSFLPGGKLLKLSSQCSSNPQAELCFPFTRYSLTPPVDAKQRKQCLLCMP
jgi:hypothetical protein